MRYSRRFLVEVARFDRCNTAASPSRTDEGLRQFWERESHGVEPAEPDPYFTHLDDGKRWWEWTLNEYARRLGTDQWLGWEVYAEDFKDDPEGFDQLRARCGFPPIVEMES